MGSKNLKRNPVVVKFLTMIRDAVTNTEVSSGERRSGGVGEVRGHTETPPTSHLVCSSQTARTPCWSSSSSPPPCSSTAQPTFLPRPSKWRTTMILRTLGTTSGSLSSSDQSSTTPRIRGIKDFSGTGWRKRKLTGSERLFKSCI